MHSLRSFTELGTVTDMLCVILAGGCVSYRRVMKKSTKPTKKSTRKKPARRAKRTAPHVLTPGERQVLLKPPGGYDDVISKFLTVWSEKRELRVPKLTRARLASMLKKALSARERENAETIRLEERRRRFADWRLVAEHTAWNALLAANSAVKAHARVDPALAEAFAFLTLALRYAPRDGGGGEEPPA